MMLSVLPIMGVAQAVMALVGQNLGDQNPEEAQKITAILTVFDSVYLNISFALKGAGDTRFVSAVALLVPWPLMVLPAYLLRSQPQAVFWSWSFVALYSLVTVLILALRFRAGKWKTMSVIHPAPAV